MPYLYFFLPVIKLLCHIHTTSYLSINLYYRTHLMPKSFSQMLSLAFSAHIIPPFRQNLKNTPMSASTRAFLSIHCLYRVFSAHTFFIDSATSNLPRVVRARCSL